MLTTYAEIVELKKASPNRRVFSSGMIEIIPTVAAKAITVLIRKIIFVVSLNSATFFSANSLESAGRSDAEKPVASAIPS
ncbi:unknown [Ligilactobacillus ruminis CAG:367]|nr:unknown [Ligilactobacillus ruminis CAG:367]